MVESSLIAYSYIRSILRNNEKALKLLDGSQIHLHVPAGATPKDGPSAGITMATAIYSLATGLPVRSRLAMTGELTLTGRVMAIGGVKEKTIAARRAGITHIIFPVDNQKDFNDLPVAVRKGITPIFAKHYDDVIDACFRPSKRMVKESRTKKRKQQLKADL